MDEFFDTEVLNIMSEVQLDWGYTRIKQHTSQFLKIEKKMKISEEENNFLLSNDFIKECFLIVKTLEEDLWWVSNFYEKNLKRDVSKVNKFPLLSPIKPIAQKSLSEIFQSPEMYNFLILFYFFFF